jgi:hypothetical protein
MCDRQQHRANGYDRFSTADFSVQQSIHRVGLTHVGGDFLEGRRLRFGQLKRQPAQHPCADFGRHFKRRRLVFGADTMPSKGQRQLQDEQLLIHQPTPRRFHLLVALGRVDLADGCGDAADV